VNVGDLVDHCLSKPGAEETYPWGEQDLVAKVGGKAFAFIGLESGGVSLKCGTDAQDAAEWRGRYPDAITVSAYIGKHGWNSVSLAGEVPDEEILELVDSSYAAIVAKLPRSKQPK